MTTPAADHVQLPLRRRAAGFLGAMLTALLAALAANLWPPALVSALAFLIPFTAVAVILPAAAFLLFFAALPLLGDAPILGQFRPSVLATAAVAMFAVVTFVRRRPQLRRSLQDLGGLVGAFAVLAALGTVSTFVNLNADLLWNLFEAGFKPLYFGMMVLVVATEFDTERRIHALSWAIICGSVVQALYALSTYVTGTAPMPDGETVRLAGTLTEYNALGSYMLVSAMFTLGFAQVQPRSSRRLLLYGVMALQVVTLLLTLTLGSIFGLVTALAVFFLLRGGRIRGLFKYGLLLAVVGLLIITVLPAVSDKIGMLGQRAVRRLATFEAGFEIIRENLLFGVGSKNVLAYLLENPDAIATTFGSVHSVPHNVFIVTFVQKGLFVFLTLVGVLVMLTRHLLRYLRLAGSPATRGLAAALVGGFIGVLQQDLTNNMLLHPRIGIYVILFAPILTAFVHAERSRHATPSRIAEA
jgi:O-antigen ligase